MIIFHLRTFKAQIMTKTRALVYHRLYGSVVERIKHMALKYLTYREKSSNPVTSRFFCKAYSQMKASTL